MARLPRFCPVGIPQHIVQRGNNRQVCFGGEEDFAAYAHWLEEYARKFSVDIHAWVFMTNHVHLLMTPREANGVSLLMQALGRRYVRYFNFTYRRSGTLWEGRFKSSLVQNEKYALICQRYIELNPVRAGMVGDPAEYAWSSYRTHSLGQKVRMWTPSNEYLRLDKTDEARQSCYRGLFRGHVDSELVTEIRDSVNKGLALGSDRFKEEIEALYGRRVSEGRMGRPPAEKV